MNKLMGEQMLNDFKAFIMRGSVVDLAVGVVIGVAFTSVVNSLVEDIITPMVGIFGMPDFSAWQLEIGQATLRPGVFLNAIIGFILIAAVVFFLIVRPLARLHQTREQEARDAGPTEVELLSDIRDELRKQSSGDTDAPAS